MKKKLTNKEIQMVSLDILRQIACVCERENYKYVLMYGTLLGAIRHKGYIPWDDDVDIMMPRNDYEALLNHLNTYAEEYPHLHVFNPNTCKAYPYMITRISDDRYIIESNNEKDCGMGVFIDIYPFDGLGNTREEAICFGHKGDVLSAFCSQANKKRYSIETTTCIIKQIAKLPVFLLAKLIGKDYFQYKLSQLAGRKEYMASEYVGCVVWLSGGKKDIFLRSWFDNTMLIQFENYQFRVMTEYDAVLQHCYGDYMKLPPKDRQIGHHEYSVYKK